MVDAQDLLLALHSEIIPGRLGGLYGMLEIKLGSAMSKANALLTVLLLWSQVLIYFCYYLMRKKTRKNKKQAV